MKVIESLLGYIDGRIKLIKSNIKGPQEDECDINFYSGAMEELIYMQQLLITMREAYVKDHR